ncbi:MAG: ATP-binding protein [Planctomycetota bacterium]|nr:ATP-binding protein [Planctomycetota bacterium]
MAGTIIILRGETLTGKTTTARLLARLLERGAHVEIDALLGFFPDGQPDPRRIGVVLASAASCVNHLLSAGFDAVVDWQFWEPELLDLFLAGVRSRDAEVHLVTLSASREARRARRPAADAARTGIRSDTSARFLADRERRGARIDTSALSLQDVCEAVAEIMDSKRGLIKPPRRPAEGN